MHQAKEKSLALAWKKQAVAQEIRVSQRLQRAIPAEVQAKTLVEYLSPSVGTIASSGNAATALSSFCLMSDDHRRLALAQDCVPPVVLLLYKKCVRASI